MINNLTSVVNRVSIPEEFESRVAPDSIVLSEVLFLRGVNLSQLDGGFFLQQFGGSLRVFRREGLAVAAPGRICDVFTKITHASYTKHAGTSRYNDVSTTFL